jgi:hypothetical protein
MVNQYYVVILYSLRVRAQRGRALLSDPEDPRTGWADPGFVDSGFWPRYDVPASRISLGGNEQPQRPLRKQHDNQQTSNSTIKKEPHQESKNTTNVW